MLAFAREGYARHNINASELMEMLFTTGFWKMGWKYMDTVLSEAYHALFKPAYVKQLQRIIPEIESRDLLPATSGVRAQAIDKKTGGLFDDIVIKYQNNAIHLISVQSPALTGSLVMGEYNAEQASRMFGLEKLG